MSTIEEWTNTIKRALENEPKAVPGRAGETPVGDLITQIQSLDPGSDEMEAVQRALERVIGQNANSDAEWWINFSNILCLSGVPSRDFGLALDRMLSAGSPAEPKARAHVYVTATDIGRRFPLPRLAAETQIRAQFPLQWIDVAVAGDQLSAATDCITEAVRSGTLRTSDLFLRLPGWFQRLGNQFTPFVGSWLATLPSGSQGGVVEWLRRRGLKVSVRTTVQPMGGYRVGHPYEAGFVGIPAESRTFIRQAKPRNASLNGSANLLTG